MKTVWFVLMDAAKGDPTWDVFCGSAATHEQALSIAESEWLHLSKREQSTRIVSVNHAEVNDDVPLAEAHDVICERGDGWYVDEEFKLSL